MKAYNMVMKIIYAIIAVAVIGAVIYFGSQYSGYSQSLESKGGFFKIRVPKQYTLIQNEAEGTDEYDMALLDENKKLYIFAYSYEKIDNFKEGVDKDYTSSQANEKMGDVSELTNKNIGKFEGYSYTYTYTDSNEDNFYAQVLFLDAEKGTYFMILECPQDQKDTYTKQFEEIFKTFKELK